jgi:hypothetical protein
MMQSVKSGTFVCDDCEALRREEARRHQRRHAEVLVEKRSAALAELISSANYVDYAELDYLDAVIVYTLMLNSDRSCERGLLDSSVVNLCPTEGLIYKLLDRLHREGIISVSPETRAEAIEFDETGSWRCNPRAVKWCLAADKQGRSFPDVYELLGKTVDRGRDLQGIKSRIAELWWLVGMDDASHFLVADVDRYRIDAYRVGPKTDSALRYALTRFSIPRVRRLVRRVVEKAVALSMSREFNRHQALYSIPGNLISTVDRAISDGWEVYPLFNDWDREPLLLRILFNRLLRTGLDGFRETTGANFDLNLVEGSEFCRRAVKGYSEYEARVPGHSTPETAQFSE